MPKHFLHDLARKHIDEAANLRALLSLRMVVGILERVAKINGLIPDKSLVPVDQRAMKFNEPVTFKIDGDHTPMGKLAKRVYGGTE